jgi:pilus assembly protein CpaF
MSSNPEPTNWESAVNYKDLKTGLHKQLLEQLDLESLRRLDEETAQTRVGEAVRNLLQRQRSPLTQSERTMMVTEIIRELFGLGPLEPLLEDPTISDILINGSQMVYVERYGKLERTNVCFDDDQHLSRIIDRIVSRVGRRVDESSPMVDARLPDGSRVNVLIPPLSLQGPVVSIRRFGREPLTANDLLRNESLTETMLELLECVVKGKLNVLVSGGTGSGKTTLLNVLSAYIPSTERIITIEDAAELQLKQQHVVRLETRPPNIEGEGAVKQRQLVINSLRMRPDRIIVGEVRGEEAIDMLQAMNTGHEGSLTTIHANTPRDALSRLETMIAMAQLNLPEKAMRQQIASAIHVIVQVNRLPDGSRKVTSISEVTGMEGSSITMQDLYLFQRQGYDSKGKVQGRFTPVGIAPRFTEKLLAAGIELKLDAFTRAF